MLPKRKKESCSDEVIWSVDPGKKSGLTIFVNRKVVFIKAIPCESLTQLRDKLGAEALGFGAPGRLIVETQYKGGRSSWMSVMSVIRSRVVWECTADLLGCRDIEEVNPSKWKKEWGIPKGKNRKKISKGRASRLVGNRFKLTNDSAESLLIGMYALGLVEIG